MINYNEITGKRIWIEGKGKTFSGYIEGRVIDTENKDIVVLKLDSGYNIAILKENISKLKIIDDKKLEIETEKIEVKQNTSLPKVLIIGVGGTIASKVNYVTGGVSANFSSEDLINSIPEIKEVANIDAITFSDIMSEDITSKELIGLSKLIEKEHSKYDAIIVTHGTDTLHYSSAALSFMFEKLNKPVVFVGSQRSSDRPSSDSVYNLIGAITFATNLNLPGVFVAMHSSTHDNKIAIHLGTKVRKMHASLRNAFKSINSSPLAFVDLDIRGGKIIKSSIIKNENITIYEDNETKLQPKLSSEVALLKFYPDMNKDIFKYVLDRSKIVVLEGTGLGHISTNFMDLVKKSKAIIFMTSQTLYGRINMNVYSAGRRLLKAGVVPLEDMLPETAYLKARYTLGKTSKKEEIIKLMTTNLKGEISQRSLVDEFY